HRCDVYSLGCMLFEMVAGVPPFPSRSTRELLAAHKFKKAPPLAAFTQAAPRWLERIVGEMLAKDPEQRPATMNEVAAGLAEAGAGHAAGPAAGDGAPRWTSLPTQPRA